MSHAERAVDFPSSLIEVMQSRAVAALTLNLSACPCHPCQDEPDQSRKTQRVVFKDPGMEKVAHQLSFWHQLAVTAESMWRNRDGEPGVAIDLAELAESTEEQVLKDGSHFQSLACRFSAFVSIPSAIFLRSTQLGWGVHTSCSVAMHACLAEFSF